VNWSGNRRGERLGFGALWLATGALALAARAGHLDLARFIWPAFGSATGLLIGSLLPVPEKPVGLDTLLYMVIFAGMGLMAVMAWPGL
jgi:hypothetical protein